MGFAPTPGAELRTLTKILGGAQKPMPHGMVKYGREVFFFFDRIRLAAGNFSWQRLSVHPSPQGS